MEHLFNQKEASKYLRKYLPKSKHWRISGHLKDGKNITCKIVDHEMFYTESALRAYINRFIAPKEKVEMELQEITDDQLHDLVLNDFNEAEEYKLNLKNPKDVEFMAQMQAYYYKQAGFRLDKFKYKKLLNERIREAKQLGIL